MKKLALLCLFLTGCAASLVPGYEKPTTYYRGPSGLPWKIHVASQWKVSWECNKDTAVFGLFVHGCTLPAKREVWTIDSWTIAAHECRHVNAMEEGGGETKEWIKDIAYDWWMTNAAFAVSLPFPARAKPCGEDFDGSTKSRWSILP